LDVLEESDEKEKPLDELNIITKSKIRQVEKKYPSRDLRHAISRW